MRVHVVESGIPQPIVGTDHSFVGTVEIQADADNTADIYVGDRMVNAALRNGMRLRPGDTAHEAASVLSNVYIDGVTGEGVFIKRVTT